MERRIPDNVLDAPVAGVNLTPGRLRDQLGDGATLLVFLRHFGCIFCRETLAMLRQACESDAGHPRVVLFFQGSATEGRALLRREWPTARAVADPEARLYAAFGIERMGWMEMLRPALWQAQKRARDRGLTQGERSGDVWRLPGVFLVQGPRLLWSHAFRHAGDLPDFPAIPALARRLVAAG